MDTRPALSEKERLADEVLRTAIERVVVIVGNWRCGGVFGLVLVLRRSDSLKIK